MSGVHLRERSLPQKIKSPVLITQRLVLRLPHNEDIDSLVRLANHQNISAMFDKMPYPFTRSDAEDFVLRAISGKIGYYVYAITQADTGKFMGCCGIGAYKGGYWTNPSHNEKYGKKPTRSVVSPPHGNDSRNLAETEVFFWLGEPFWGRNYGEEVMIALVDVAFRSTDIEVLYARAHLDNIAACKILQKCGFSLLHTSGSIAPASEKVRAVAHYHLSRQVWLDMRSQSV